VVHNKPLKDDGMKLRLFLSGLLLLPTLSNADDSFAIPKLGSNTIDQVRRGGQIKGAIKVNAALFHRSDSDQFPLQNSLITLNGLEPDRLSQTRSASDAALFKSISPSVVLIVNNDSLGSGTLINKNGEILTNYHVVGTNKEVGVIFKPLKDVQKLSKTDVRRVVIKVDQVSDLALIKVSDLPVGRVPTRLGDISDIGVGIDVHAIGHPKGEAWTYTKGVVSQYRNNYIWQAEQYKHQADVIQTQTPINPGNSGGPLLSNNGVLIGVNTFKETESEGLNFAVSVDDVKKFLTRTGSRYASATATNNANASVGSSTKCEVKETYKGQTADKTGDIIGYDSGCTGKTDLEVVSPYDQSQAIFARLDRNLDGKVDAIYFSFKRDMKWDLSFWDMNYDGEWDMVGYHSNGEITPNRYISYKEFNTKAPEH
jgi:Trypsin-like peptidase domain